MIKRTVLTGALLMAVAIAFAQEINRKKIEDSVLGWKKVYNFKGAKAPLKVDDKTYSIAQLSIADSFVNWMQASYVPKGGLGDVKKSVTDKLGLYNQHTAGLPQRYGVYATTYFYLKYNTDKTFTPANNLGVTWGIMANGVPTDWAIRDLCTATEFYFTLPSFESTSDAELIKQQHDLSNIQALKPYTHFWVKNVEAGGGTDYIMLSKNNKSPYVKLTKGAYLQLLENAIPVVYARDKKKLYEKEQGNQKSIDYFMKYLDEKNEKRKNNLAKTKEKYKNQLSETALISKQPSLVDLENGYDVFSNGYLQDASSTSGRVPVYKIDPAMAALSKTDKPQWILVSWWWSANDPVEKLLHESIINNFNFEYVYNFFFDPEKVKGQKYRPLRAPSQNK